MFGAIVLRDVPKKEARIDTTRHEIQGGFRGFGMVPPVSWHYVGLKAGAHHVGFWCYLLPQEVVVKVFDSETGEFRDADGDTQAHYAGLALSGALGSALVTYPHTYFGPWFGLVQHIPREGFPPRLYAQDNGSGTRFDKALHGTHGGDNEAFLAEFQYAFVSWYVSLPSENTDEAAFDRWRHLVLAAYNAGEDAIRNSGDLFPSLVDTLQRQFDVMGDEWFEPGSFLVNGQAGYMAEDMIDTGVPAIAAKGEAFAAYLKKARTLT